MNRCLPCSSKSASASWYSSPLARCLDTETSRPICPDTRVLDNVKTSAPRKPNEAAVMYFAWRDLMALVDDRNDIQADRQDGALTRMSRLFFDGANENESENDTDASTT